MWVNADAGTPAYAADELRRGQAMFLTQAVSDRFGARSGVHPAGADAVTLSGTTVTVQHLKAVVYPGVTTTSGPYVVQQVQTVMSLAAADGANPRKDIVVLRIYDDGEDASGRRESATELITGSPAASPAEPAVPAGAVRLATITVPQSGGGGATLTYNAPYTVAAGGVIPVRNDAELPATSGGIYDGMVRWNQATNELQVHNGASAWETVAGTGLVAGTVVAHLRRTTAQLLDNTTSGASATAISWNLAVLDRLTGWNSGVNPTRYTPNVPGWYTFSGSVSFVANTTGGIRGTVWRKNGSAFDGDVSRPHVNVIGNATVTAEAVTLPLAMNGTTDYVELAGLHDASADINTSTGGFDCVFMATYGGPL